MILHVVFLDGSNPYVSLPTDRRTVAKMWRQWMKNHPDTARPMAMCGSWKVLPVGGGGYALGRHFDGAHTTYNYERLGNALAALERMANR